MISEVHIKCLFQRNSLSKTHHRLKSSTRGMMLTSSVTSSALHPHLSSGNIKRQESSLRLMVRSTPPDLFQSLAFIPLMYLMFFKDLPSILWYFLSKITCEFSCERTVTILNFSWENSKFDVVFICSVLFVESSLIWKKLFYPLRAPPSETAGRNGDRSSLTHRPLFTAKPLIVAEPENQTALC